MQRLQAAGAASVKVSTDILLHPRFLQYYIELRPLAATNLRPGMTRHTRQLERCPACILGAPLWILSLRAFAPAPVVVGAGGVLGCWDGIRCVEIRIPPSPPFPNYPAGGFSARRWRCSWRGGGVPAEKHLSLHLWDSSMSSIPAGGGASGQGGAAEGRHPARFLRPAGAVVPQATPRNAHHRRTHLTPERRAADVLHTSRSVGDAADGM